MAMTKAQKTRLRKTLNQIEGGMYKPSDKREKWEFIIKAMEYEPESGEITFDLYGPGGVFLAKSWPLKKMLKEVEDRFRNNLEKKQDYSIKANIKVKAATPEQKEIAKKLKALFKKLNIKVSVLSSSGKAEFIQVMTKDRGAMPVDLRNTALDVIYGKNFTRDRDDPNSGNVTSHGITMKASQWKDFLDKY